MADIEDAVAAIDEFEAALDVALSRIRAFAAAHPVSRTAGSDEPRATELSLYISLNRGVTVVESVRDYLADLARDANAQVWQQPPTEE